MERVFQSCQEAGSRETGSRRQQGEGLSPRGGPEDQFSWAGLQEEGHPSWQSRGPREPAAPAGERHAQIRRVRPRVHQ